MSFKNICPHIARYAAGLALGSLALPVMAAPYWTSTESNPVICATPEDAIEATELMFRLMIRPDEKIPQIEDLVTAGRCRKIQHETKLLIIKKERDYTEIRLLPAREDDSFIYIASFFNGPFDDEAAAAAKLAAAKKYPPGCREPGGGEIDRMEVGAHGQLFLKRYFITEKCVNGQMRQFTKRLN